MNKKNKRFNKGSLLYQRMKKQKQIESGGEKFLRFVFLLVLFSGSVVLPIVLLKYFPQFWPNSFYVLMAIVTLAAVSLRDK
ncbi:TPA: hypothetical protein TZW92_001856 [Streptococcus suis]|nr:hypothetical protein [Streptococcus suis]